MATMITPRPTPGPSSSTRRQALAGRGRRSIAVSPADKVIAEKDILSIIEQPCPEPISKKFPSQQTNSLPTVPEAQSVQPSDAQQPPGAHSHKPKDKASSLSQRFEAFFCPSSAAEQQQGDGQHGHTGTQSPRPPTSNTERRSRHHSLEASPLQSPHRIQSRSDSRHSYRREPYSASRRHRSQSVHSTPHDPSDTPRRVSSRHRSRRTGPFSHKQLQAFGESLVDVVDDHFLNAFGDFAPKLLSSIEDIFEQGQIAAVGHYRNHLATALGKECYQLNAALNTGVQELSEQTSHQHARLATTTIENHARLTQLTTDRFNQLYNVIAENQGKALQTAVQHNDTIIQAVNRNQQETVQHVDALTRAIYQTKEDVLQDAKKHRGDNLQSFAKLGEQFNLSATKHFTTLDTSIAKNRHDIINVGIEQHDRLMTTLSRIRDEQASTTMRNYRDVVDLVAQRSNGIEAKLQDLALLQRKPHLNPAMIQEIQDSVRAVIGVPPNMTLVQMQANLSASQVPPTAVAPVVIKCCPSQLPPNGTHRPDDQIRTMEAVSADMEHQRRQADSDHAQNQGEVSQALDLVSDNSVMFDGAIASQAVKYAASVAALNTRSAEETMARTALRSQLNHAVAQLHHVSAERDTAHRDADSALALAYLNHEVGDAAFSQQRASSMATISNIQAAGTMEAETLRLHRDVLRLGEERVSWATHEHAQERDTAMRVADDAMRLVDLNQEMVDATLIQQDASSIAALSHMESTVALQATVLRHERDAARSGEREASDLLTDAMDLVAINNEADDATLLQRQISSLAAISQIRSDAASEACVLRDQRDAAQFQGQEASHHLDNAMDLAVTSHDTADAILDHQKTSLTAAMSQLRSTTASRSDIMHHQRHAAQAALERTRRDLDVVHVDLQSAQHDLTNALDLHSMQHELASSTAAAVSATTEAAAASLKTKHEFDCIRNDIRRRAQLSDAGTIAARKDRQVFNLHLDHATSQRRINALEDAIDNAGQAVHSASHTVTPFSQGYGWLQSALGYLMKGQVGDLDDDESDDSDDEEQVSDGQ